MTIDEAASNLRELYRAAPRGDKSISVVLFGLKHADDLAGLSVQQVVLRSGIPSNYSPMVNQGRKLARYVALKDGATDVFRSGTQSQGGAGFLDSR